MNRLQLRPWRAVIVSIVLGFTLAACSSTADKKPQRTAEELYDDAQQELSNGAWDAAARASKRSRPAARSADSPSKP